MDYIKRQAGKLRKHTVYSLLLYHRGLLGNTIRWVFRLEPPGLNNRVVEMAFVGMWGKNNTSRQRQTRPGNYRRPSGPSVSQTHTKKGGVSEQ